MKNKPLRFLVATDYSETSFTAYNYACELAYKLGANITLLYVIQGSFNTNEAISFKPSMDAVDRQSQKLKYFAVDYPNDHNIKLKSVPVEYQVRFGMPGFTVTDYAHDNKFDMIIMGTKGNYGVIDRMLGTTTSIAIRTAKCPIIIVHKDTKYNEPHKVVFGIDKGGNLEDAIESFHEFNQHLRAKVDFVHVNRTNKDNMDKKKEEIIDELFEKEIPNYSIEIKSIDGDKPKDALKDYCLQEKADMLILMHKEEGLFDALFDKSFSVKMVHDFHLPVMIIPE